MRILWKNRLPQLLFLCTPIHVRRRVHSGVTGGSGKSSFWDPSVSLNLGHPLLVFLEKCTTGSNFKMILAQMMRLHLTFQTFAMSRLLYFSTVSYPEFLSVAIVLFEHFTPRPNLYIYNTMISAVSFSENKSVTLYKSLMSQYVRPNEQTFLALLKSIKCASLIMQIHLHILTTGLDGHLYLQNSLIKIYTEIGKIDLAENLFQNMPMRDSVSYNIMLFGCAKNSLIYEAFHLFHEMDISGIKFDDYTVVSLLICCGQLKDLLLGKSIHGIVVRRSLNRVHLSNALLDMYAKCMDMSSAKRVFETSEKDDISWNTMVAGFANIGSLDIAYSVFTKAPSKNTTSWNALLTRYCQDNDFNGVLELFQEMLVSNVVLDKVTAVTLLSAVGTAGMFNAGRSVHGWVVKEYGEVDAFLGSALVDMYCKCGDTIRAYGVFEAISIKDVTLWTAMIHGFALNGNSTKALRLFSQMQEEGILPNGVTLVAVLTACSHAGLVDEGYHVFEGMQQNFNIDAQCEHYGCMVDLLARSGRLDEAISLIKKMQMKPTKSIWGSILSAAKESQNKRVGEIASRALLELDSAEEGAYILLSNLYAIEGSWSSTDKIRKLMEAEAIKKSAGSSSIIIDGVTTSFLSSDSMHQCWALLTVILFHLHRVMKEKMDFDVL